MSEVLEGVLSEAVLDELASDLGIQPDVLRKHPFFRVYKGRVLLTYPLKTTSVPTFKSETGTKTDPVGATYYPVHEYEGKGVFYGAFITHDDAVTNVTRYLRVTVDGVVINNSSPAEVSSAYYGFAALLSGAHQMAAGVTRPFYVPFAESLEVTMAVSPALAGGKILNGYLVYGEN